MDNKEEEEYLFADEIMALINDDKDEYEENVEENNIIEDINKSETIVHSNEPTLRLIDDKEDIFGTQTLEEKDNKESPKNSTVCELFGELSDDEFESNDYLTKEGKLIKDNLTKESRSKSLFEKDSKNNKNNVWTRKGSSNSIKGSNDDSIKDIYSGIRLINPLISSYEMKERMNGRKMIKMSLIKSHINKADNDIDGDWVTIGVIVAKVPTKLSKNGKQYSIWKLSDLKTNKVVSFFLFGDVYAQHWKLPVSSVIGLLNPKIMSEGKTDSKYGKEEICSLTIDNSGKLLEIGTAKDLGYCKAVKKNEEICGALVNLSEGEYCIYHVKNAYKKLSSKRAEIQSSFSNMEPKKYSSNNNTGFFANNFSESVEKNIPNIETKKCNQTQLKHKKEIENKSLSKVINNPISVAARNLAVTMNESNRSNTKATNSVMSAQDVFKMIKPQTNSSSQHNSVPTLAKGYKRGQMIDLNTKSNSKLRALQILKTKPIKTEDPNNTKRTEKSLNAIISKIDNELSSSCVDNKRNVDKISKEEKTAKKLRSDLIEAALKRKSINDNEVDIAEANAQEKYFTTLEKKEKLENKLLETTEIECVVVSCRSCKYTAHSSSELCRKNFHKLVKHKAIKRFFKCKTCKNRSFTFNLLMPAKPCSKCGQSSYEKTSMINIKAETSLSNEKLLIRGEEQPQFFNSIR